MCFIILASSVRKESFLVKRHYPEKGKKKKVIISFGESLSAIKRASRPWWHIVNWEKRGNTEKSLIQFFMSDFINNINGLHVCMRGEEFYRSTEFSSGSFKKENWNFSHLQKGFLGLSTQTSLPHRTFVVYGSSRDLWREVNLLLGYKAHQNFLPKNFASSEK